MQKTVVHVLDSLQKVVQINEVNLIFIIILVCVYGDASLFLNRIYCKVMTNSRFPI